MLEQAVNYALRGWHVFPLAVRGKAPVTAHGFKDATLDLEQVRSWWNAQPKSNIGIAMGASGLVVLDVDPRNGGEDSFARLELKYDIPETLQVYTGGGGRHLYFRAGEGRTPRKTVLASGLDLVAKGAYVVAPPSVHPCGNRYEWVAGPEDVGQNLAVCPEWLVDLANGEEDLGEGGFRLTSVDNLEHIVSGERNNTLIRIAGAMRRWGMSAEAIGAGLQIHNQQVCHPPLPDHEVERIAQGVTRYEPEVDGGQNGNREQKNPVSIEEAKFS